MTDIKDSFFEKFKKHKLFILLFFSILCFIPVLTVNPYSNDLAFHIYRIESIADNFKNGIFLSAPQAENMAGWGYNLSVFYPSGFLYPFAALNAYLNINPVICFYSLVLFFNVVTGVINYYAMNKYSNNEKISFYFALLCIINPVRMIDLAFTGFLGSFIAMTFFPVVVIGMFDLLKNNRWKLLSIGMIGLIHSHLISLLIAGIFVFVFSVINIKKINIITLIKAAVVSFLCGAGFLIPFVYHYTSDIFKLTYNAKKSGISTVFNFNIIWPIAFIFQILLILFLVKIKKIINIKTDSKILSISICVLIWGILALTDLFPWELIEKIPFVGSIQMSNRILCVVSVYVVFILLDLILSLKDINVVIIVFLVSMWFLPQVIIGVSGTNVSSNGDCLKYNDYKQYENSEPGTFFDVIAGEYLPLEFSIDNKFITDITIEDIIVNKIPVFSEITEYEYSRNNLETIIDFKTEDTTDVIIPLVYYVNYHAYLDGKEVKIQEKEGRIFIEDISSGHLIIKYELEWFEYVSAIISICSLFLFTKKERNP